MRISGALGVARPFTGRVSGTRFATSSQAREDGAVGLLPYLLYQQAWHALPRGPPQRGLRCGIGGARPGARARTVAAASAVTPRPCCDHGSARRRGASALPTSTRYKTPLEEDRSGRVQSLAHALAGAARGQPLSSRGCDPRARDRRERPETNSAFTRGVIVPRSELAEVHARTGETRRPLRLHLPPTSLLASLRALSRPGDGRRGRGHCSRARRRGSRRRSTRPSPSTSTPTIVGRSPAPSSRSASASGGPAAASTRASSSARRSRPSRTRAPRPGPSASRAELRASGETLRRRKSWEAEELTPQELQICAPRRPRDDEPGGRRRALPLAQDDRVSPRPRLPEAGHALPRRADQPLRARSG